MVVLCTCIVCVYSYSSVLIGAVIRTDDRSREGQLIKEEVIISAQG